MSQGELGRRTGIRNQELDTVLEALEKEGHITTALLQGGNRRQMRMIALKKTITSGACII